MLRVWIRTLDRRSGLAMPPADAAKWRSDASITLWADEYDDASAGAFDLQDKITESLVDAVGRR
jgi:TolB-like protein